MELLNLQAKLKAWFPPEAHKSRELPGGGNWYFIPWQLIRERLDEVCPDWQVSYSDPRYVGDYCTITCTITIGGISRQGVGNAEIVLLSSKGRDMSRGTPIERATADAFKNAAEAWGVGRYLDEQSDPKSKQAFIRYMQAHGDAPSPPRNGRQTSSAHESHIPAEFGKPAHIRGSRPITREEWEARKRTQQA